MPQPERQSGRCRSDSFVIGSTYHILCKAKLEEVILLDYNSWYSQDSNATGLGGSGILELHIPSKATSSISKVMKTCRVDLCLKKNWHNTFGNSSKSENGMCLNFLEGALVSVMMNSRTNLQTRKKTVVYSKAGECFYGITCTPHDNNTLKFHTLILHML